MPGNRDDTHPDESHKASIAGAVVRSMPSPSSPRFPPGFYRRIPFLSIYLRLFLGNSLIIFIGAVAGTLLTRRLTSDAASVWLIVLFAGAGILLSISVNSWIVYKSLLPFHDLLEIVKRAAAGQTTNRSASLDDIDPDFEQITAALNSIVNQLEERNRQLRALSERAIQAQEKERIRIARCLHDDTGQSLSTLIIALERLENRIPESTAELEQRLVAARRLAAGSLEELRRIIYDLRPSILDDLGLVSAIRWYARTYLEPQAIQVRLFMPEEDFKLPEELATALFRITQEAISNIVRHAAAKTVMITLCLSEQDVSLQIKDDGLGFDVESLASQAPPPQRLGLLGIQERVDLLGGVLSVESNPGQGSRLQICLPLP
jgi:two-component system, NarL family, sensor histidine kinase UhpB